MTTILPPEAHGPPDGLVDWRKAERKRLIAAREAMTLAARAAAAAAIDAALMARFPPGSLALVAGYWPIRGEYDARGYLRRSIEAGASAALPVALGPGRPLEFRPWTPAARMEAGRWVTQHPADGPAVIPTALLVPLLGFDAAGHRLGFGAGYYDRTLAALWPRPLAVGVGFEIGRLASIDPQPHDQPMDAIVTEAGVFEAPRG